MKIDLFGDWCPGNREVLISFESEMAFINIEGPILEPNFDFNHNNPFKHGPKLWSLRPPLFAKKNVFSFANNHIMDFGLAGLNETLKTLQSTNGFCVGFESDSLSAKDAQFHLGTDRSVHVIAIAERQFGFAENGTKGYIPLSSQVYAQIKEAKDNNHFVIVSCHGGDEKSLLPSFERRALLRSYIDSGADVVWGHHSHVPQGWEFWNGGLICYGLGNFVTDPDKISHQDLGSFSLTVSIDTNDIRESRFGIVFQELIDEALVASKFSIFPGFFDYYFSTLNKMIPNNSLMTEYHDMYSKEIVRSFYSRIIPIFPTLYWPRYFVMSVLSYVKNFGKNAYGEDLQSLKLHINTCETHRDRVRYFLRRRHQIQKGNHIKMLKLHTALNEMRLTP